MNYKSGIEQLRIHLVRTRQSQALEQLSRIERQLQWLSSEQVLDALNKLSWRTAARPFNAWIANAPRLGFKNWLSLKRMLWIILLLVGIPAFILGTNVMIFAAARERGLQKIRETVSGFDNDINRGITAPFYLNPQPDDPCIMDTVRKVRLPPEMSLLMEPWGREGISCKWKYFKDNSLIAVDTWSIENRILIRRDFYQDNSLLATDTINLGLPACVKQRIYANDQILKECYSENSHLISINPQLKFTSPLPPMLYWFFYR
jgi:hypothetical protein